MIHSKDYVTNLDAECIQPNAVDLRVDRLFKVDTADACSLLNHGKSFRDRTEVKTVRTSEGVEQFHLQPGIYDMLTCHDVSIPEGSAGWLIIRSTLARNGILLGNGLYDAGYNGVIGGILHVPGPTIIERASRVAQFVMVKADTDKMYDGHYNRTGGVSIL